MHFIIGISLPYLEQWYQWYTIFLSILLSVFVCRTWNNGSSGVDELDERLEFDECNVTHEYDWTLLDVLRS